jgi:hypothetical protein
MPALAEAEFLSRRPERSEAPSRDLFIPAEVA